MRVVITVNIVTVVRMLHFFYSCESWPFFPEKITDGLAYCNKLTYLLTYSMEQSPS
jgi:hypothetical protein